MLWASLLSLWPLPLPVSPAPGLPRVPANTGRKQPRVPRCGWAPPMAHGRAPPHPCTVYVRRSTDDTVGLPGRAAGKMLTRYYVYDAFWYALHCSKVENYAWGLGYSTPCLRALQ